MIARNCDVCQAEYQADPRYLNRGQGRTCSKACGTILSSRVRSVNGALRRVPNTECQTCHTPLYRKPSQMAKTSFSFCDTHCQRQGVLTGIIKTGPVPSKRKPYEPPIPVYNQNVSKWLDGDNESTLTHSRSTGLPTDTKSFVKRYLVETRGDKCEKCGFAGTNIKTGNSIIQMDHTNGNCFDNHLDNLRLLCPNCHAMTETYGSLNKGSGRAHRRKRSGPR